MSKIAEEFPTRLVKVVKNVNRGDGQHEQTFHVKQAAPGDQYGQTQQAPAQQPAPEAQAQDQEQAATSDEMSADPAASVEDEIMSTPSLVDMQQLEANPRIQVEPLMMPWDVALASNDGEESDPIPAEIRKRFDPDDRSRRVRNPFNANVPVSTVRPGEDLIWGANEAELLNRLRSGVVTSIRPSASMTGFIGKIESTDGLVERAYIRFEDLIPDASYALFQDLYGITRENGGFCRRSAVSYELAKAAGFDDIIPPTVFRVDEHNGLEPILSIDVLDDLAASMSMERMAMEKMLGDIAAVELWVDDSSCIYDQLWFREVFSNAESLNSFFSIVPPEVRIGVIRGAVFDFLAWTGMRTWADLAFASDPRHLVRLAANDVSVVDPAALGMAVLDYTGSYTDGCPTHIKYGPLLWSDLVSMTALRGFDAEVADYEKVAISCAKRLQGPRAAELIRVLADHQVPLLGIAGIFVRAAFLRYGARTVMRDPLVVARYFSSVITGMEFDPGFEIDLEEMVSSLDEIMSSALLTPFSFVESMQKGDDE